MDVEFEELKLLRSKCHRLELKVMDWKFRWGFATGGMIIILAMTIVDGCRTRSHYRTCGVCNKAEPRPKSIWICPECKLKIEELKNEER